MKIKLIYKIAACFFIIFHFHPNENENIYKNISYYVLLIVFLVDFIKYLIKFYKNINKPKV